MYDNYAVLSGQDHYIFPWLLFIKILEQSSSSPTIIQTLIYYMTRNYKCIFYCMSAARAIITQGMKRHFSPLSNIAAKTAFDNCQVFILKTYLN
jgi:hypothetical protein